MMRDHCGTLKPSKPWRRSSSSANSPSSETTWNTDPSSRSSARPSAPLCRFARPPDCKVGTRSIAMTASPSTTITRMSGRPCLLTGASPASGRIRGSKNAVSFRVPLPAWSPKTILRARARKPSASTHLFSPICQRSPSRSCAIRIPFPWRPLFGLSTHWSGNSEAKSAVVTSPRSARVKSVRETGRPASRKACLVASLSSARRLALREFISMISALRRLIPRTLIGLNQNWAEAH